MTQLSTTYEPGFTSTFKRPRTVHLVLCSSLRELDLDTFARTVHYLLGAR